MDVLTSNNMDNLQGSPIAKNDSYSERRKLFKNIWETAINMDDKVAENGGKSKIIKTLRLGERDVVNIGKSKKQRIKNLRTVCTRLLDYCDRQDEADILTDQMSITGENSAASSIICTRKPKSKKKRKKKKKKIQQIYSYDPPKARVPDKNKMSFEFEVTDGPVTHRGTRPLRDMFSPRIERANLIQQFLNERYNLDNPSSLPVDSSAPQKLEVGDVPRKVVKKHKITKKKLSKSPSIMPRETSQLKKVPTRSKKKKKKVTESQENYDLVPLKKVPRSAKKKAKV